MFENMLTWQAFGGCSFNASVRIGGSDHAGRERLVRYWARPAFTLVRLHLEQAAGQPASRPRTHP